MNESTPSDQTCSSALHDDLKAYLDDELAPPARLRIQDHLRTCPTCAKELLMLQTTQTRLREELHEQAPPAGLHRRILSQIESLGIDDEQIRRDRARGGLIPRRYLPLAVALSTLITAVALFPMVAHLREKARQAEAIANGRQIGFALTQYYQDYDEKFPSNALRSVGKSIPVRSETSVPARKVSINVSVEQPETAADTIAAWEWTVKELPATKSKPTELTVFVSPAKIERLLLKLQKLGKTEPQQIRLARALAVIHPTDELEVGVRLFPEKTR